MNEIQEIQFNMLLELDKVCRKHNIKYYLAYGTCLGAVRHKGFIPWDHDVDVVMPIKDARKLLKYQKEFSSRYFISSRYTDPNHKSIKFLIVDRDIKCNLVRGDTIVRENERIGLDIVPFYNCPMSKYKLMLNVWRSHLYKLLIGGPPQNHGRAAKLVASFIIFLVGGVNKDRMIARLAHKLDYKGESKYVTTYFGFDVKLCSAITYKKEWFEKPGELLFEGSTFWGPSDPDQYLTKAYGDYMTPVPVEERENLTHLEIVERRNSN